MQASQDFKLYFQGGTDIIACFMGQTWTEPVYRGEIQQMILGCDMQAYDINGKGKSLCLPPFVFFCRCFLVRKTLLFLHVYFFGQETPFDFT